MRLDRILSGHLAAAARARAWLHALCAVAAHSGDGALWLSATLAGACLLPEPWRAACRLALGAMMTTALLVGGIKLAVRRPRPGGPASARWSAMRKYDVHSFPSGHAARMACLAAALWASAPGLGPGLALWALAVGLARVAVGAHYLVDVLAGLLVGALVGGAWVRLWPLLGALLTRLAN
ncbi:MAG: phosphatase PAP2 family protein [Chloroflexota bacterium]